MQPCRFITEDEVLEHFIRLSQKKREGLLEPFRPVLKNLVVFPAAERLHWRRWSLACYLQIAGCAPALPLEPLRSPDNIRQFFRELVYVLASQSPGAGEIDHRDANGRMIYRWEWKLWRICFWDDGPVNETRIVDIEARR